MDHAWSWNHSVCWYLADFQVPLADLFSWNDGKVSCLDMLCLAGETCQGVNTPRDRAVFNQCLEIWYAIGLPPHPRVVYFALFSRVCPLNQAPGTQGNASLTAPFYWLPFLSCIASPLPTDFSCTFITQSSSPDLLLGESTIMHIMITPEQHGALGC